MIIHLDNSELRRTPAPPRRLKLAVANPVRTRLRTILDHHPPLPNLAEMSTINPHDGTGPPARLAQNSGAGTTTADVWAKNMLWWVKRFWTGVASAVRP